MFRSRSVIDEALRTDARHQAEITSWWRDWHRYLEAQQQLFTAREAELIAPPSFERSDSAWEQQRADAEQTYRRIPADRRALFDRTRDARRAELENAPAAHRVAGELNHGSERDLDALERRTLETLLSEAEGTRDGAERWGAVPLPTGWYELEVDALLRAPAAADYLVVPDADIDRRKRWTLAAALLVIGTVAVWLTWPGTRPSIAAPRSTAIAVDGQSVTSWTIRSVVVNDTASETTLAVTATMAPDWPELGRNERGAWWRRSSAYPIVLCVAREQLERLRTLNVRGDSVPGRRYTLAATRPERPDLVVEACDSATTLRYGVLQTTLPVDMEREQAALRLPNGTTLRAEDIRVIGPAQDEHLPAGRYRVVVRASASAAVDWVALAPRLVFGSGVELLPAGPITTQPNTAVAEITYLATAWTMPVETAWIVRAAEDANELRWRTTLAVPQARAGLLAQTLGADVRAHIGADRRDVTLQLRLHNTGSADLVLRASDLVIRQHDRELRMSAAAWNGVAIAPGATRELAVPVTTIDPVDDIVVRLGAAGYRLVLADEGGTPSELVQP